MLPPVALVLDPALNDNEPVVLEVLDPEVITTSPALPPLPLVPVERAIAPESAFVAAPVAILILPEDAVPASSPADCTETLPPTEVALLPAKICKLPPLEAAASPALRDTAPPIPVDETPTTIVISPLVFAPDAIPDAISIEPLALPVDFELTIFSDPVLPLVAVFKFTCPLPALVPSPVVIDTVPPNVAV